MQRPHEKRFLRVRRRIGGLEAGTDRLDLGIGGGDRHAFLEAAEGAHPVAAAVTLVALELQGEPELAGLRAHPRRGELKAGRHDAHDRDFAAVDPDTAADEPGVARKRLLP